MLRYLTVVLVSFLLACSSAMGQYVVRMMPQDGVQPLLDNYTASAVLPVGGDADADVRRQLRAPGLRMLMTLPTKGGNFGTFYNYVNIGAYYGPGSFRWVYVYDEMFWENGAVAIGAHETAIATAAEYVRHKGMKSAITMMPDVILHPNFALPSHAAYDVIGIDIYHGANERFTLPAECNWTTNWIANMLACSLNKLRYVGYAGEVWYVGQGFVHPGQDITEFLDLQYDTILAAPGHGITGFVNYGYAFDFPYEPPLVRGQGSAYDEQMRRPLP